MRSVITRLWVLFALSTALIHSGCQDGSKQSLGSDPFGRSPGINGRTQQALALKLRIAADAEFRAKPNWQAEIKRDVAVLNEVFTPTFNMRFMLQDVVEWDLCESCLIRGKQTIGSMKAHLKEQVDDVGVDLVVGYSGIPFGDADRGFVGSPGIHSADGHAEFFGSHLVIRHPAAENWSYLMQAPVSDGDMDRLKYTLTHEMGHMFGGIHTPDGVPSVMNGSTGFQTQGDRQFDDHNQRIISLTAKYAPEIERTQGEDENLVIHFLDQYFSLVGHQFTSEDYMRLAEDSEAVGDPEAAESYLLFAWYLETRPTLGAR